MVDDDDLIGQAVRLLEVLRGEEDGRATLDEAFDHPPEIGAAAGVETRRRFVEEQHRRLVDERAREVDASPHPTRVRAHESVAGVVQVEALEEVGRSAGQHVGIEMGESTDELQVLRAR